VTVSPSSPAPASTLRRVAAIDIGTNSIHLLIAAVDPLLHSFSVVLAEKSATRLGERDPETGHLSAASVERAFLTLRHCRDLAHSQGVEQIVTAATSAVREATNGREFLATLQEQLGLEVDLVSGPEEARLIYLGVLSGMSFGDAPHFILDIGGGSTELVLADVGVEEGVLDGVLGGVRGGERHRDDEVGRREPEQRQHQRLAGPAGQQLITDQQAFQSILPYVNVHA
jgi:exopolyphosphatase/guanosine-5'-triphosphate,3'-diphosphate pyrophosphatase